MQNWPDDIGIAMNQSAMEDKIKKLEEGHQVSLRDWFAGMALQGMIANEQSMLEVAEKSIYLKTTPSKYIANMMYEIADAMLEARKK